MVNHISDIETFSDQLAAMGDSIVWEDVINIIDQQTDCIARATKALINSEDENQRLALIKSVSRAHNLQKILIQSAHKDREKAGKAAIELTNRKKMLSAYNEQ